MPTFPDFVFPAAWRRFRYARRGSAGAGSFTPDPQARSLVDAELERAPGRVRAVLESGTTPEDLRAAGLAWLAGDPAAPPAGAAAVAASLNRHWHRRGEAGVFADLWIAERGTRFAAEAAVQLMALILDDRANRFVLTGNDSPGVRGMHPGERRPSGYQLDLPVEVLLRVRSALAALPEEEFTAIVAVLEPYRAGHAYQRAGTSVLVPGRTDWVEQDVLSTVGDTDDYRASALITAVSTVDHARMLAPLAGTWDVLGSMPMLTTLVDGIGPAAAPALFTWFDQQTHYVEVQRRLLTVLVQLPGDEVLTGLADRVGVRHVAPALLDAAGRFPAPALRVLAEKAGHRPVADLLHGFVRTHAALAAEVLPELSEAAADRVRGILDDAAGMRVAPVSAVPPLLVDPPWLHPGKPAKPVVITGLTCDDPPTVRWLPGEREAWLQTPVRRFDPPGRSWKQVADRVAAGRASWFEAFQFFTEAPEELARPLVSGWRSEETWYTEPWMRVIAARLGADALPPILALVTGGATDVPPVLMPFASPGIAVLAADWLARLKTLRRTALEWLLRHPAEAARALVPPALGKAGTARRQAEQALLALHTNGQTAAVRAAASSYGTAAADAVETLLATDPLSVLPVKPPAVPAWALPDLLPPVHLRDGSGVLPAASVAHLVTILSVSRLDDPYPGVKIVREACEPASLAEFAWGVFHRWTSTGGTAKENWALDALGLFGDDETVRRLTPLILAWPGEGGHARAVAGVNVLAAIGTDVALMHLHGIAQRAKFKGLRSAAEQRMAEVAAGLGLSSEELADRLVPDLGLDADGSLRLDYGPRQFVVGFDEQLRPFVLDSTGKRLKALPKPGARDDAELAPAAYQAFSTLKKDVRTIATDLVRRLEQAMVGSRRWTGEDFQRLFVGHPLVRHVVRRLVWGVFDEAGTLAGSFRVAEDSSFATVEDEPATIPAGTLVGVPHPLHLGDSLAAWSEVFADYEILQPFPQLGRPVFALTAEEAAGTDLVRFEQLTVPATSVLSLERRGWQRESPQDAGIQGRIELTIAPGLEVGVDLEPGIVVGDVTHFPEQKLTDVYLHDGTGSGRGADGRGRVPLSALSAVAASELLRDLTELTTA
ncbi:DUF4132 domain-containing protein [Actinoplanes sp. NBRC 101535]|uniref:DUF4132 domain-containing protein n=1 Tax=Actinoplanes sp. NBRC 101535 TaxID=3032196 RepID=UPI0024A0646B|nr:DUF4132 domain-containing protein [Actinoplanes sp. NBRC 101535]GLY05106.1 hypothetical protein Acsp01_54850 [Actinoplanes sp. NBRC 101535]